MIPGDADVTPQRIDAQAATTAGGDFFGREQEMGELKSALQQTLSGQGRLVMLTGEPGIGKSRTSQELAAYAYQNGCRVIWGRCNENPGAPPYWPWVQVIRSYIRGTDAELLYQVMGDGAVEIAEIVPEVRSQLPGLGWSTPLENPDQARFRLFDSITGFFKAASQKQPMAFFLDNLHWADKPSLLLLEFLVSEIGSSPLLIAGTYRDIELSRRHPLSDTLAELTREPLFRRIQLRGLGLEEVSKFIFATAGVVPPPGLVAAIYGQTGGNPLFVTEVVRLMMEEGQLTQALWHQGRSVTISIPEGIREVIGRRLNRLSENCARALSVASVIGREFGVQELKRLLSDRMSEDSVLDALEEAEAARIVEEAPQVVDRYQFTHVLIRETLYDELASSRRTRLHRRIAEALEDIYQSNVNPHLARIAYHFCEAAHAGDPAKTIDYATRAAERDTALLAYEEAILHYEMALHAQEIGGIVDEARRCGQLIALGDAHKRAGDFRQAMETFQKAASVARKVGSADDLARSAIGFEDASWRPGNFGQPAAELLQTALAQLGDENGLLKTRVMAALVRAFHYSGLQERASTLGQQVLEMARSTGDSQTLAQALDLVLHSNPGPQHVQARLAGSTELIDLVSRAGNTDALLDVYSWYITDLLEVGDRQSFHQSLDYFQRQADQLRQPFYLYFGESMKASLALAQGHFEEAELRAREAFQIGQRLKGQDPSGVFGMEMFVIYKERGRLAEVAPAMSVFLQQHTANSAWRPGLALIYSELGMESEARSEFENLAADKFSSLPQDALYLACLAYLSEVCAFLGDVTRAAILYQLLLPWNGHNLVLPGGVAYYGCASRHLGLLAATMSRWEDAERHYSAALEMDSAMGARTWLTHSQFDYARLLLTRNGQDDHRNALELLDKAMNTAGLLGMGSMQERILGLQTRAKTQPVRAPEYPDGLTQREVEVLRLVATGKTNREIAEDLFISVGTVSTHVKNLLNKTNCSNRTGAAAYAARQGLV